MNSNRRANIEHDDWSYRRRTHLDSNQHTLPMGSLIDRQHYLDRFHRQPTMQRMRILTYSRQAKNYIPELQKSNSLDSIERLDDIVDQICKCYFDYQQTSRNYNVFVLMIHRNRCRQLQHCPLVLPQPIS